MPSAFATRLTQAYEQLPSAALVFWLLASTACGIGTTPPSSSSSNSVAQSSSSASSSSIPVATGYQNGEFIVGMDISYWSEQLDANARYMDTDGQTKDLLTLFKHHGINFIRLRTFVDPWAKYGYASNSGCPGKAQAYNSKDDILRTAKKVKAAGMGLLLDFHYSDTWADPSKQVIPEAWRNAQSIDQLATEVRLYTQDVLESLAAENALPNMVQVGNEITPGMLVHVPTSSTDCWGNNSTLNNRVNGQASNTNWANLAKLLNAGIQAVKQVDPSIQTVLHIESTGKPDAVRWWVDSALANGVTFDVLGLSAYEEFQGPASAWRTTLTGLSSRYPKLSFVIAEYNPQGRLLNDIMRELPGKRGLGTFFWEPTESGFWGKALFTRDGSTYKANSADFAVYDTIVKDFGLRKIP